jgi:ring-1,2-phenylacetyl-CoA epoxidase subunit PaaD
VTAVSTAQVWQWLDEVMDPEIPVVSVVDLGIVRAVEAKGEVITVTITPTYSGCPATEVIARDVREALVSHGVDQVSVETSLAPAWTTDWLTPRGREALLHYGIAPPSAVGCPLPQAIACPRCGSSRTALLSRFGSTPCKALYRCEACLEPFDHFKCH